MGKPSIDKGKRGELELSKFLTANGFPARRGQQFRGGPDSPDIICPTLSDFHIECKRTEKLSLYPAWEKAREDAGKTQIPLVCHRRNKKPWLVVLTLEDFLDYLEFYRHPLSQKENQ